MDRILGTYVGLDEVRPRVVELWAVVVVDANRLAMAAPPLERQRRYVLDRATWAVTEVEPSAEMKSFRPRFWSHDSCVAIT